MNYSQCMYELSTDMDYLLGKYTSQNILSKKDFLKILNKQTERMDKTSCEKYRIISLYMFNHVMKFMLDDPNTFIDVHIDGDDGFFESSYFDNILNNYSKHFDPNEKISRELLILSTIISFVIAKVLVGNLTSFDTLLDLDIESLKNHEFDQNVPNYIKEYLYNMIPLNESQHDNVMNVMEQIFN